MKITFLKSRFVMVVFLLFLNFTASMVSASGIDCESDNQEYASRQLVQVDILLSAQEMINAVEGTVLLPENLTDIVEIRDGGTIVSLWIERPYQIEKNKVFFSGIIPGGYSGDDLYLFSIIFQVRDSAVRLLAENPDYGEIKIKDIKILKHDGEGTPLVVDETVFSFQINDNVESTIPKIYGKDDNEPPEAFIPELLKESLVAGDRYILVFSTNDKGVGLSHYDVLETRWTQDKSDLTKKNGNWLRTESPYIIKDQKLISNIYIRAVDKSGNVRIVEVVASNRFNIYAILLILGIILLVFISLLVVWKQKYILKKKT